jgi:hypothetical protein
MLSGAEIRGPVLADGPFIMNERSQIDAAFARYRAGERGHLSAARRAEQDSLPLAVIQDFALHPYGGLPRTVPDYIGLDAAPHTRHTGCPSAAVHVGRISGRGLEAIGLHYAGRFFRIPAIVASPFGNATKVPCWRKNGGKTNPHLMLESP